ncbi:hypothetical protein [Zunongwangia pacifica]|uniref:Uncharacterized protein n=1 Tax=Zunongwangia pacifica TaxID=2911062 RepID=A0A9X1ZR93_9FLAO|nr:hypothetical protein [Zunongwangia pacifica]MCL6219567.1 hypothetical protein [Zunongwangia pacifica]
MDTTFLLLLILTAITFVHIPLATLPAIEAIIPSLFPTCKNKYSNYHPGNNILRSIGSLAFLILPIFIFSLFKSLIVENELAHTAIICLFICITLYLIYFNRTSFWSKNFKTVENPEIKKLRQSKENDDKINGMKFQIEELSKKIIVKPRKSELRNEKVKVAKQQFELFKSDLKKLPEFNSRDKKFDSFKDENLTELQTYQTALWFFKENYNLMKGTLTSKAIH